MKMNITEKLKKSFEKNRHMAQIENPRHFDSNAKNRINKSNNIEYK